MSSRASITVLPVVRISPSTPDALQVRRRLRRGGEMQARQLGDQAAVGLLREGVEQVVGAQARLDVADGDLLVEGGQGAGEGGGGVPLHQDEIGAMGLELFPQPLQGRTGDVGEGLLRGHQGQVMVGGEAEQAHHLGDHLAVLPGEHHAGAELARPLERQDDRSQLDGLRARAQHDGDQRRWGHVLERRVSILGRLGSSLQAPGVRWVRKGVDARKFTPSIRP